MLTTPGLRNDIRHYTLPTRNNQIRHQATRKVSCQPSDYRWPLSFSSRVCVGICGLTYLLYHPDDKEQNDEHIRQNRVGRH